MAMENPTSSGVAKNGAILCMERVTKIFPGTVALDEVDFNVYRGKVNALVGENGAGKTTLMKLVAGVEQPTKGRLLLEGEEISVKSPREAAALGIGIIHQELNLFPYLSVAENIFMAREVTNGGGVAIAHKIQEERTRELLARLEQPIDPRSLVGNLRIGQQQIVEIAKALAQDTRILIMDEPTSALSAAEVAVLFKIITDLKAQGVSIVYISHRLEEIMKIGDYITVLRDGKLMEEASIDSIDVPWIVTQMVGYEPVESFHSENHTVAGRELVRVKDLTLNRPGGEGYALDHVSFSLQAGEVLGVYGLMGAGRTEMVECLVGLHPEARGEIWVRGKDVQAKGKTIDERIHSGICLIPENRQEEGLIQCLSVAQNMTLASLWNYLRAGVHISKQREKSSVDAMIRDLSIKVSDPQVLVSSLSGGNQQKVVVGKSLLTSPRVLLMDEPTRGIDVGAKAEIFAIMNRLAAEGLGILFVASELKEIMGVADRILVMSKGKVTGEFTRDEATKEALVKASAVGHGPAT